MQIGFEEIFGLVGVFVGVAGLVYAWYINRQAKRILDVSRSGAWFLYQSANTAGGVVQKSLSMYKSAHEESLNPEIIEQLAKADQLSLTVYHDCIRYIQLVEPTFSLSTIDYWVENKKILDTHADNFKKIVIGNESKKC